MLTGSQRGWNENMQTSPNFDWHEVPLTEAQIKLIVDALVFYGFFQSPVMYPLASETLSLLTAHIKDSKEVAEIKEHLKAKWGDSWKDYV